MHKEINEMFDLTGKVALITGGARHLGYDAACILGAAGADLVITSRHGAKAQESAARLTETYKVDAVGFEMDQSKFDAVKGTVNKAAAWKERIDVLINNAGGGSGKSPTDLFGRDPKDIDGLIHVNLNGLLYCCREVGRIMSAQGRGKIINIASIAGLLGRDRKMYERHDMSGQPVDYAAAKAGVLGATYDLSAFLAPMGVHVNAISPGGFARDLPDQFVADYSERTALGRMGRDGIDLKGAILFLASSASDYVIGHNLVVDGGFSVWH